MHFSYPLPSPRCDFGGWPRPGRPPATSICVYICVYVYTCLHTYIYIYIYTYNIYIYIYTYIYIYIYLSLSIYIYIYIYLRTRARRAGRDDWPLATQVPPRRQDDGKVYESIHMGQLSLSYMYIYICIYIYIYTYVCIGQLYTSLSLYMCIYIYICIARCRIIITWRPIAEARKMQGPPLHRPPFGFPRHLDTDTYTLTYINIDTCTYTRILLCVRPSDANTSVRSRRCGARRSAPAALRVRRKVSETSGGATYLSMSSAGCSSTAANNAANYGDP